MYKSHESISGGIHRHMVQAQEGEGMYGHRVGMGNKAGGTQAHTQGTGQQWHSTHLPHATESGNTGHNKVMGIVGNSMVEPPSTINKEEGKKVGMVTNNSLWECNHGEHQPITRKNNSTQVCVGTSLPSSVFSNCNQSNSKLVCRWW